MRLQASDLRPHLTAFGFSEFTKEKNGGGFRFGQFAQGVILVHRPKRKWASGRPEARFHGGNISLAALKPVSMVETYLWLP